MVLPGHAASTIPREQPPQFYSSSPEEAASLDEDFLQDASSYFLHDQLSSEQSRNGMGPGPIVGKFAGNIYKEEFFTDSVYYDYFTAFWEGYNMQLYLYADECRTNTGLFFNSFH